MVGNITCKGVTKDWEHVYAMSTFKTSQFWRNFNVSPQTSKRGVGGARASIPADFDPSVEWLAERNLYSEIVASWYAIHNIPGMSFTGPYIDGHISIFASHPSIEVTTSLNGIKSNYSRILLVFVYLCLSCYSLSFVNSISSYSHLY